MTLDQETKFEVLGEENHGFEHVGIMHMGLVLFLLNSQTTWHQSSHAPSSNLKSPPSLPLSSSEPFQAHPTQILPPLPGSLPFTCPHSPPTTQPLLGSLSLVYFIILDFKSYTFFLVAKIIYSYFKNSSMVEIRNVKNKSQ